MHPLSKKQALSWHKKWFQAYAIAIREETGKWGASPFDAFYYMDEDQYCTGFPAEEHYRERSGACIVLFGDRSEFGYSFDTIPSIQELRGLVENSNVLVMAEDLSWTFLLHHEDWVPSIFCELELAENGKL